MNFEMNRTWSQALALVKKNFQLLAVLAGVFLLLPSLVFYLAVPDVFSAMWLGGEPEDAARRIEAAVPQALAFGLVAMLMQLTGYMAMIALIGDGRPTVGEAIARGLRSLPTIIAAFLIFLIAYMAVTVLFGVLIGLAVAALGEDSAAGIAFASIASAVLLVAIVYVLSRLSLTMPVIALEEQRNPLAAMRRSWRLTAPRAWAIVAFFVLIGIAYLVIAMVLLTVISGLGAASGGDLGGAMLVFVALVYGLLGMAAAMVMSGILVSMHGQLAGPRERPGESG